MSIHIELAHDDPDVIALTAEYRLKDLIKSVPGTRWNNGKDRWQVPLSWTACVSLREVFPTLTIGPQLAEWATSFVQSRVAPGLALRELTELPPGFDATINSDLFPHQQVDVEFLALQERAMLFSEPGAGKTAAAVRTMRRLAQLGKEPWPALVVAPNSTKIAWGREFEQWWPGIKVVVVKGTALQRRKQLETPAHVYVMNYESLRAHSRIAPYGSEALARCQDCGGEDPKITTARCQVHLRELNAIDFKMVIADEVHRVKAANSKTARCLMAASGDAPYRLAMTGTPVADTVMDVWAIMHWLEPKEFSSRTRFIEMGVSVLLNAFGGQIISGVRPDRLDWWDKIFTFRMRRMLKSVVLDFLPPIIRERRDVEMSPKQAKAYKQLVETLLAEVDAGTMLSAAGGMVSTIRLLQLASAYGTVELGEPHPETGKVPEHLVLGDPSSKLDAFMEDLEDWTGQSVAVFTVSSQLLYMLSARMTKAGIAHGIIAGDVDEDERQEAIDNFQAGRTKFILLTIAAGGTGITLTKASTAVFLQRSWSVVEMNQAENRVHRIGSEIHDKITLVDYVTLDSIEEAVIGVLHGKYQSMEEILRDREAALRAVKGVV